MKKSPYYWHYRKTLETVAFGLLRKYCPGGPPFDPFKVAEGLKVAVKHSYLCGLEGYVERKKEGKFCAVLSLNGNSTRRRFTLSHELGHVVLIRAGAEGHMPELKRYRSTAFRPEKDSDPIEESLCNDFASELLMPSQEFEERLANYGVDPVSISLLARDFDVSLQAAAVRTRHILGKRFVSCSFWDLRAPWPVPLWWIGKRTNRIAELSRLEMLVRHSRQTDEFWKTYNGGRSSVRVQVLPKVRRRFALTLVSKGCLSTEFRATKHVTSHKPANHNGQLNLFGSTVGEYAQHDTGFHFKSADCPRLPAMFHH